MTEELPPQANELLYAAKLRTGEEILFTLVNDDDEGLIIESPIKVSVFTFQEDDHVASQLITQKWFIFADTEVYFLPHIDIISYAPMAKSAYKLYVNAVNRYQESIQDKNEEQSFFIDSTDTIQ